MKGPAIFQSATQNILRDAAIASTVAPMTNYPLEVLGLLRPDFRVRWDTGAVTIRFTHGGGSPAEQRQGDIFYLAVHNFDDGSPVAAVLTNDQGLVQPLSVPEPLENGLCRPIVVDLTILTPDASVRTPSYWELEIDNVSDLTLGGAIAIYGPKTYLIDRDVRWGYTEWEEGNAPESVNPWGAAFVQDLQALIRGVDVSLLATDADAAALRVWNRSNGGRAKPSLFWFDSDIADAFLGRPVAARFSAQKLFTDANQIEFSFAELWRGLPLGGAA